MATKHYAFHVKFRFTLEILFSILLFVLSQQGYQVISAVLKSTNETKIIKQIKLGGICKDYNGVEKSHLESWPSSAGACDEMTCFAARSANFVISATCAPITDEENPDSDNCQEVENMALSFPDCCPTLECASSPPLTTISPTLCYDRSKESSCLFWSSVTDGCTASGEYFDFIKEYCKKTCGLC